MTSDDSLVTCVERAAGRLRGGVAHHRGTYETACGPVEVEVALAWPEAPSDPLMACATLLQRVRVNGRESSRGRHLYGLHDALDRWRRRASLGAVVALDVRLAEAHAHFSSGDVLDSLHVREPVAAATTAALVGWAEAYPEAAAGLPPRVRHSHRESIRMRPEMYVGGRGGDAVAHLTLEIVSNAFDQYLAGRCTTIDVRVDPDDAVTVTDDGPGLRAAGQGGVPALTDLLTRFLDEPTADGHRPHVHLGHGGWGLSLVNNLSELVEVVTVRDGEEARGRWSRGDELGAIQVRAVDRPSGTCMHFQPDLQVFTLTPEARQRHDALLTSRFTDLARLAPGLTLTWTLRDQPLVRGDLDGRGLVGMVERTRSLLGGVGHRRATYETPKGPLEVDVAVGWRTRGALPHVHSFVNFDRTTEGDHVEGVLQAARGFLASYRGSPSGLVAAVHVVLADVLYGSPIKDHVDDPHVRAPVADATRAALTAWAEAHPEAAATVRARTIRR